MKIDKAFLKKFFIVEAAVFILLTIIDQISKILVVKLIPLNATPISIIPHIINFTYIQNTGAAFGLGEGGRWVFVAITPIVLAGFGFAMWKMRSQGWFFTVTMAVIMSGAFGNFIDRLFLGYVRDFIQFDFWDSFAIFNIADCALVIGVILMAVYVIFLYKEQPKDKKDAAIVTVGGTESAVQTEALPDERQSSPNTSDSDGEAGNDRNL